MGVKIVDIPFLPEWEEPMRSELKRCTTRSKRYGKPGDQFLAFGMKFELLAVDRVCLALVAQLLWVAEGCLSAEHFMEEWARIHPRRGFQPHDVRWVHQFVCIDPSGKDHGE
jgi:hypothetical protein